MTNLESHKFLSPRGEYSQKIFVPFFSTVKMQYAVVFFAFSSPCGACLPKKKKAGFWAGVCQISTWLWILVSWPRPTTTLSSSPSSSSMPLSLWEDWVLSVYHSLQRFEDQPWVPMLPILAPVLKVLWDLMARWEPRWRFLLCTSEGPASVSQQLAGQTVVPVVLPLCTAMFLYWQHYCFH